MSALWASVPAMVVLTGLLVGLAALLPGTFLILRGAALAGDAIAHAVVFGIVVVWLATGAVAGPLQLLGAGLAGLLAVAIAEALARTGRIGIDAALGLAFPALFAAGVLLISLNARNLHLDADAVLLGQIGLVWVEVVPVLGLELPRAVLTLAAVLALNAGLVAAFWKELKLASFDPDLAEVMGLRPRRIERGLLLMTAVTAVASFEAVGAVLFISFLIVPAATGLLLAARLPAVLAWGAAVAAAAAGSGYALAAAWDVSIGGMMAVMAGVAFGLAWILAPRRGLVAGWRARAAARRAADGRLLALHLAADAGGAETEAAALEALAARLGWPRARAARALREAEARGLLRREGGALRLTPEGRAAAAAAGGEPSAPEPAQAA